MKKSISSLDKKKEELETSLARIQEGIDKSIDEVKGDVIESLSPGEVVKKYPLPIVGAAIVVGFILGSSGRSRKDSSKNVVANSLGKSLKKRLTEKATDIALNYIEEKIVNAKSDDSTN